jgi:hypothetical protein
VSKSCQKCQSFLAGHKRSRKALVTRKTNHKLKYRRQCDLGLSIGLQPDLRQLADVGHPDLVLRALFAPTALRQPSGLDISIGNPLYPYPPSAVAPIALAASS